MQASGIWLCVFFLGSHSSQFIELSSGPVAHYNRSFIPDDLLNTSNDTWDDILNNESAATYSSNTCIESCDWSRPVSYMLPTFTAYAIGLVALVLSARVRSLPENFRDARSLYALLIGLFLIVVIFTPIFAAFRKPRLDFQRCITAIIISTNNAVFKLNDNSSYLLCILII